MVAYRKQGVAIFRARARGRKEGSGRKLEPWQMGQVARAIRDQCPDQLKLPFYLWTREAVVALVKRRYGVRISRWTAGRYLKRWGFTPQKPIRQAFERDEGAVRRWLKEEYPAIRQCAGRVRALIFWADEMGVRSDHSAGRSFSPRGQKPVVRGTGKRFGCNMISALTNQGHLVFRVFHERFTSAVFIDFLSRLVRQYPTRKIFLVVDRHPAHVSAATRAWVAAHKDRIELFFLPAYSPDLNPDEFLNQDVKNNAVARGRPRNREQLVKNVRGYLRRRQRQPGIVRQDFAAPSVRYAAA